MMQNYQKLIEKISSVSGLPVDEIDRRVEAKCAKLSGLISKEGSAQIVASELGVNFDNEKMKVNELMAGMKKVNIIGKVLDLGTPRSFTTKNGIESKVLSMKLADETGNIRTVLWDTNHIALFEKDELKNGSVIEVGNATVRNDELHLGSFSEIKKSDTELKDVKTEVASFNGNLASAKPGQNIKVRGFVVQMFEPRFFEVCPQCNKKAVNNSCAEHGAITPSKRALISIVIDDGTETMKGVIFHDRIKELGIDDGQLEDLNLFEASKQAILGEEYIFDANVRNNSMFNSTEMIINGVRKVELDSLIDELKN